jgi:cytochrome c-type protein NapC
MKEREINRLKANDSQECRNCHDAERMVLALQSTRAQKFHKKMLSGERTCIDCHSGIAHPDNSD